MIIYIYIYGTVKFTVYGAIMLYYFEHFASSSCLNEVPFISYKV